MNGHSGLGEEFLCDPSPLFWRVIADAREKCKAAMQMHNLNVQSVHKRIQFSLLVGERQKSAKFRDSLQLLVH